MFSHASLDRIFRRGLSVPNPVTTTRRLNGGSLNKNERAATLIQPGTGWARRGPQIHRKLSDVRSNVVDSLLDGGDFFQLLHREFRS